VPRAEIERLQWLYNQFRELGRPPGLFHATRVRLDGEPCGSDGLSLGWEEFLPGTKPFEFSCFETAAGPDHQQGCFYGKRSKLQDYTPLAVEAIGLCRPGVCPTLDHHRNARPDRDQWTIGLYSAANMLEWDIAIDSHGSGPYAAYQIDSKDALAAVAGTREKDRLQQYLATLAGMFRQENRDPPRFMYAAIATDVCAASAQRIQAEIRDLQAGKYDLPRDVILPGSATLQPLKQDGAATVAPPGGSADGSRKTGGEETIADPWPPDEGWHFRGATFAFRKRTGRVGRNAMRLLRTFVDRYRRLSKDEIKQVVWSDSLVTDEQVRGVLQEIRDALRQAFGLRGQNPVPHDGWGEQAVWWVDKDMLTKTGNAARKGTRK